MLSCQPCLMGVQVPGVVFPRAEDRAACHYKVPCSETVLSLNILLVRSQGRPNSHFHTLNEEGSAMSSV